MTLFLPVLVEGPLLFPDNQLVNVAAMLVDDEGCSQHPAKAGKAGYFHPGLCSAIIIAHELPTAQGRHVLKSLYIRMMHVFPMAVHTSSYVCHILITNYLSR